MGCRLRVHVWGARSGRTLGTLRLCARGSLGAHSWGSRSGCSPGLRARAANSRCSWGAGWGCALRVCAWAANSGRELEVLLGCRVRARRRGGGGGGVTLRMRAWAASSVGELEVLLGVQPRGCTLRLRARGRARGCAPRGREGGWRWGPSSGGALCPPCGGFPAEGCLFQEMAFACGSCYRNERLCPSAPAPKRAKASREGRPRGAGVELLGGGHDDDDDLLPREGLRCDIPRRSCATAGTRVTCSLVASCSLPARSDPAPSSLPAAGVPLPVVIPP